MRRKPIALVMTVVVACLFAATPTRAAEATSRPFAGAGGGGMILDRAREIVADLKLSDEQEAKVDAIFQNARKDFQELRTNLDALEPRERMERARDFMQTVRQQLGDVLTPEQREAMNRKFEEARENFRRRSVADAPGAATTRPDRAPGGPGGPETRRSPGMLADRLRENLQKLELSDEQKAKVKDLLEDVKARGEALRAQLQSGGEEARDKMRQLFEETRQKLANILTEEQRTKLRDLMGGPPGERPGRPDRAGSAAPTTTKADAGADMMMMDGDAKPKTKSANRKAQPSDFKIPAAGPAPGDAAPDLTLRKLDGSTLQLSSLRGRVVVLEFGSYSCPSFRNRAAAMEKLRNDYGPRAQFYVVYTREAHATGEWEVDRNKDEGIQVEQPKTLDARKTLASAARDKLKITVPILIDSPENEAAKAFGTGANSAYVINRDGKIAVRQEWFEPNALRRAIDEAVRSAPSTRPATP